MGRLMCAAMATALFCAFPAANPAMACTCQSGFAFAAYAASDEIFTGRILTITRDATSEIERLIVRVRVAESIKGSAAGDVEVLTGSTCGFAFEQSRDYLIYAKYEEDVLVVRHCNRTRTLDLASVDLAYVAGVREGRLGTHVYGSAAREWPDGDSPLVTRKPLRLVLSGEGRQFETPVEDGTFEFHFVPPGTYTLSAIGAEVVKTMSAPSRGTILSGVTIHQGTDVFSLTVTLRIKGIDTPDSQNVVGLAPALRADSELTNARFRHYPRSHSWLSRQGTPRWRDSGSTGSWLFPSPCSPSAWCISGAGSRDSQREYGRLRYAGTPSPEPGLR